MPNKQEYFQRPELTENGLANKSSEFSFGLPNGGEILESSGRYGRSYLSAVPAEYKPANDSIDMKVKGRVLSW